LSPNEKPEIVVGMVIGVVGVQGEARVRLETDFPERLVEKGEIQLCSPSGEFTARRIESVRIPPGRSDTAFILFEGCKTRDDALALKGCELRIFRNQLVELPEDEYYSFDLVGLDVFTTDGRCLGKITEVLRQPANDVFVTDSALIPALKSVVQEVDICGGKMIIRPVPGLLD